MFKGVSSRGKKVIVKLSEVKLALRGFEQANCSCSSRGRQCFDRRVVAWHK